MDRPMPHTFCYRTGLAECSYDIGMCAYFAEPITFDRWLSIASGRAIEAVLGDEWEDHPFRRQLLAAVGDRLAYRLPTGTAGSGSSP